MTAKIGDPALSGVWQPTGDLFEVVSYGQFYLRERDRTSPNGETEGREGEVNE